MPESPEVDALAGFLDERLRGRAVAEVEILEFRVVKTRQRPPESLVGHRVSGARRHGKHVELTFADRSLIVSLGRHGWARWSEPGGARATGPGTPPALVTIGFDDGVSLEWSDAGGWVSLGLSVVDDATEVPAIAKLGPDPADAAYTRSDFDRAFGGRRKQVKAILQEQESIAGIGNAYSDEILHLAKISPVVHAAALAETHRERLFEATLQTVREAIASRRGIPIDQLKAVKVAAMRVHGRAGETDPVCGDMIRDFAFASTTAQYCPTCQTAGVLL